MKKGLDERIDEGMLQWFGHVKWMENGRIAKRVYVAECVQCVGRNPRWTNTVKECFRKRGLDIRQARRIVHENLPLTRCHSCGFPQLYEALEG